MSTVQIPWRLLALALGAWLVLPAAARAAAPTKEEVAETAKWFDGLEWPELAGKPYVEIVFGKVPGAALSREKKQGGEEWTDGPSVRGFLLGEDKRGYTVFLDGIVTRDESRFYQSRPLVVRRIKKIGSYAPVTHQMALRRIELPAAVEEALAGARRPESKDLRYRNWTPPMSSGVALFGLARWCARAGRADLAARLDAELPALTKSRFWPAGAGNKGFRAVVENEVAHGLLQAAKDDCANAYGDDGLSEGPTRPALLAEFARIARDFPESADYAEAAHVAEILAQMVTEDARNPSVGWEGLQAMTPQEQARALIFQLRDQAYGGFRGDPAPVTPVEQLVQLGYAAVPALIETLGDPRLTRSVSGAPWDKESGPIITFGDCAVDALSQIANRKFGFNEKEVRAGRAAPRWRSDRPEEQRREIEAWWKGMSAEGEWAALIQSVRAGGDDAPEKAQRLAEVDPAALMEALTAGLDAAKNDTVRDALLGRLVQIKTEAATAVLRREMWQGKDLQCRVASALELFDRGGAVGEVVPAMIAEFGKPLPKRHYDPDLWPDDPGRLIEFLGRCGDLAAMQALAARLPQLTPDLRGVIVESVFPKEPPPKPIPADVEALAEKLAVHALDDRALAFEPWPPDAGNSGGSALEAGGPRVRDLAAAALERRWPDRYPLKEAPGAATRLECDAQYAVFRNTWRLAQGLPPLPVAERPSSPAARENVNVIAEIRWIDGAPVAAMSKKGRRALSASDPLAIDPKGTLALKVGQPLTGKAFMAAAEQLQKALADEWLGVTVSAERLGDGRGMVVEIEPLGRRRAKVKHAMLELSSTMDMDLRASVAGKPAGDWSGKDFGGGGSYFQDEKHSAGIDAALQGNPAVPVAIYFQSVVGQ